MSAFLGFVVPICIRCYVLLIIMELGDLSYEINDPSK